MNHSRRFRTFLSSGAICAMLFLLLAGMAYATEPQIPNIFLNNKTRVEGSARIHIDAREGGTGGNFDIWITASCAPPNYPAGRVEMQIDMSDSSILYLKSTTVEALSSTGKHTPTAYIMGRCVVESQTGTFRGCHYWVTLADNRKGDEKMTPDIVGFLVLDGSGIRIAYGTGPVVEGDIDIPPTPF